MGLSASAAASNILSAYDTYVDNNGRRNSEGEYIKPPSGDRVAFASKWAKSYHDYAKGGTIVGLDSTGSSPAPIEAALLGIPDGGNGTDALAQAFADFWSAFAVTSGFAAHGGSGWASASNDAASKVGAFKAAILSSYTTSDSKPYFNSLISNVEGVVKTIIWTTVETGPSGGSFPETIS